MKISYRLPFTKTTIVIVIVLIILALLFYFLYRYAVDSPYRISSQKAKELLQKNKFDVILDVRTDLERSTLGFYPGSVHIPSADLEKQMPIDFPDKNLRILAYCNSGQRARMATEKLHKLGYQKAVYIATPYQSLL
jgi:rhodanese-related sulfurtransferase